MADFNVEYFVVPGIVSRLLTGMTLIEYSLDLLFADVQIDLGAPNGTVSEQILNNTEIGPVVEQMGSKGVPE